MVRPYDILTAKATLCSHLVRSHNLAPTMVNPCNLLTPISRPFNNAARSYDLTRTTLRPYNSLLVMTHNMQNYKKTKVILFLSSINQTCFTPDVERSHLVFSILRSSHQRFSPPGAKTPLRFHLEVIESDLFPSGRRIS